MSFTCKHLYVLDAINAINHLLGADGPVRPNGATFRMTSTVGEDKTFLAYGTPAELAKIEETLICLDKPASPRPTMQFKTHALRAIPATEAIDRIRLVVEVPRTRMAAGPDSKILLVNGPPEELAKIEEVLTWLDGPTSRTGEE